jgi:hypothetical protein
VLINKIKRSNRKKRKSKNQAKSFSDFHTVTSGGVQNSSFVASHMTPNMQSFLNKDINSTDRHRDQSLVQSISDEKEDNNLSRNTDPKSGLENESNHSDDYQQSGEASNSFLSEGPDVKQSSAKKPQRQQRFNINAKESNEGLSPQVVLSK